MKPNHQLKSFKKRLNKIYQFFKTRKFLSIIILIILFSGSYFAFQKLRPKSPQELYQMETVSLKDLSQTVTASGQIQSQTQVDIKFQTSGLLSWVGVQKGDYVQKWQAIASLDQRELTKKLQQELIDYSKQRHDFEQDKQVTYKDTVITDTIKRILDKNQWDLERAVLDVEIQDLSLKLSTITSPIDGIVTYVNTPVPGINILSTSTMFTVADPQNLEFQAEIDEIDIGLIAPNQKAQLVLDAYPNQVFDLTVDSIDFASSLDSSGSTVFLVKFKLTNPDFNKLRLGMNGEVTITTAQKQQVPVIPIEALLENETTYVRLLENNKLIEQQVTTGIFSDEYIEILSGLKSGQTIAVSKKTK